MKIKVKQKHIDAAKIYRDKTEVKCSIMGQISLETYFSWLDQ
jgi:hypothetical protein